MLLGGDSIHPSRLARRYASILDLSSGRALRDACIARWPHYGEVIRNRKSCVLNMADRAVSEGAEQMVIFGAGYDSLSLEIHSRHPGCRIFELDIANMDAKARMVSSLGGASGSIRHISIDIAKTDDILPALSGRGWSPDASSVLIFEGISYYLPRNTLWETVGLFGTPRRTNRVIMEYFVPEDRLAARVIPISSYPFEIIAAESDIGSIIRYDPDQIRLHAAAVGGVMTGRYTLQQMELERTSRNEFFPAESDGWIEVCVLAV